MASGTQCSKPLFLIFFLVLLSIWSLCNGSSARTLGSTPTDECEIKDNRFYTVTVNGSASIARVSDDFICVTMDYLRCNLTFGPCFGVLTDTLHLDLTNAILINAVRALSPLVRAGGTLEDILIYDIHNDINPCPDGNICLTMNRWDELQAFLNRTHSRMLFGLNAMVGRRQNHSAPWNSSNSREFIEYTVNQGYEISGWEFGNELVDTAFAPNFSPSEYAQNVKDLRCIIDEIYSKHPDLQKPLLIAPDANFNATWFQEFIQESGPGVVEKLSHHLYTLGRGNNTNIERLVFNGTYLNKRINTFRTLQDIIKNHGPWAKAMLGEAGGAYNGGSPITSSTFVNSFWYLDELGMAATFDTDIYCRQSLIQGNYGLLNMSSFLPNPDYFCALLWKQVMDRTVLSIEKSNKTDTSLRVYAHCTKHQLDSITLLLINLSNTTRYFVNTNVSLVNPTSESMRNQKQPNDVKLDSKQPRYEYHLTSPNGDPLTRTILLNGTPLKLQANNRIPALIPIIKYSSEPISVLPISIVFVTLFNVDVPACEAVI
ncbi:hypothetical protein O6H91_12G097400 [Diphasiastrum complanatum]|uniref:Uncharacterized protein n=1 Tax=Diphasiastrum complanatum TaxID=34168 RepID=A0ACC2C515_DIPCM|nr:hypothetical protein O6H91_12G097400 [Diphasiastrum complanatum]